MRILLIHGSSEELAAFLSSLAIPATTPPERSPDVNDTRREERRYWTEILGEDHYWVDAWLNYNRRG